MLLSSAHLVCYWETDQLQRSKGEKTVTLKYVNLHEIFVRNKTNILTSVKKR